MKRRVLLLGTVLLTAMTGIDAIQRDHVIGKIVDVQERTRDRGLLYQVNTPIMTEDSYVTISVDVNGIVYEGELLPRNHQEVFSDIWKARETVQLRLDKHFMYLGREDGSEAKFLVTGKARPQSARESH